MKRIYRSGPGRLRRVLGEPGMIETSAGAALVLAVIAATLCSSPYAGYIDAQRSSPYAIDYVNQPPYLTSFGFLVSVSEGPASEGPSSVPDELSLSPGDGGPAPLLDHELHLLGTDEAGRDLVAAILSGAQTALLGSLLALFVSCLIGIPGGIITGYLGGRIQRAAQITADALSVFPRLIVLIIVISILGYDFHIIMTTIGVLASTRLTAVIATRIRLLKESQYVESARELGLSDGTIIFKHILWHNCRTVILIQLAYEVAEVILLETSLSYLGFGVQGQISWGKLVAGGMGYILSGQYWKLFFPALAIVGSIFGFMLLADGLNRRFGER